MGIGSGDREADMRFEKRADRAPGAGVVRLPQPAFDVGQQVIGQNGNEQMGPGPVGRMVEDGTQAQIGLERPERRFDPGEGRVEGPDPGGREIGVGGLDDIGSGGLCADLPGGLLLPGDPVCEKGGRLPGLWGAGLSGRLRSRPGMKRDGIVAGDGRIAFLDSPHPPGQDLEGDRSFCGLEAPAERGELFQEALLPPAVDGLFLGPSGLGEHEEGDGAVLGRELVQIDPALRAAGIGSEPFEGLPGRFEKVGKVLFGGTPLDHAIGEAALSKKGQVGLRGDAPIQDDRRTGEREQGALCEFGKPCPDPVQDGGERLGFGDVPRVHMALEGEPPVVDDQGEADERAVAALLLGLAPPGQLVALGHPFQVGVGQVVKKDQGVGGKVVPGHFGQSGFESILHGPQTIGHDVDGILSDRFETVAEDLRKGGACGEPSMGGQLAPGGDEPPHHDGLGQSPLLGGEAGGKEHRVDVQALPGLMGDHLGPQGADLSRLERVAGDHRSPGRPGARFPGAAALPGLGLVLGQGVGHDRLDLRSQGKERGPVVQAILESLGENLEDVLGEVEAAQIEKDAVPGPLLGLDGFHELVGDVNLARLGILGLCGPNEHEKSVAERFYHVKR